MEKEEERKGVVDGLCPPEKIKRFPYFLFEKRK